MTRHNPRGLPLQGPKHTEEGDFYEYRPTIEGKRPRIKVAADHPVAKAVEALEDGLGQLRKAYQRGKLPDWHQAPSVAPVSRYAARQEGEGDVYDPVYETTEPEENLEIRFGKAATYNRKKQIQVQLVYVDSNQVAARLYLRENPGPIVKKWEIRGTGPNGYSLGNSIAPDSPLNLAKLIAARLMEVAALREDPQAFLNDPDETYKALKVPQIQVSGMEEALRLLQPLRAPARKYLQQVKAEWLGVNDLKNVSFLGILLGAGDRRLVSQYAVKGSHWWSNGHWAIEGEELNHSAYQDSSAQKIDMRALFSQTLEQSTQEVFPISVPDVHSPNWILSGTSNHVIFSGQGVPRIAFHALYFVILCELVGGSDTQVFTAPGTSGLHASLFEGSKGRAILMPMRID